jgi:hypothetical protein
MRRFIIILTLFFSTGSFGQQFDKETFVNEVFKVVIDTTFPYYKLSKQAQCLYKNAPQDLTALRKILPDTIIIQVLKNGSLDTTEQFWDCDKLIRSRCTEYDSMGFQTNADLLKVLSLVTIKRNETKKEKKLPQHAGQAVQKPIYDQRLYSFSRPIFDNKKEYAVISMSYVCGMMCGHGCTYIFKKAYNIWTLIARVGCWIS